MNPLYGLLIVSAFIAIVRFIKGPDWADRIMIFDLLTNILIAAAVIFAIETREFGVLSFALLLALLSFISTIAMVFLLEKDREKNRKEL